MYVSVSPILFFFLLQIVATWYQIFFFFKSSIGRALKGKHPFTITNNPNKQPSLLISSVLTQVLMRLIELVDPDQLHTWALVSSPRTPTDLPKHQSGDVFVSTGCKRSSIWTPCAWQAPSRNLIWRQRGHRLRPSHPAARLQQPVTRERCKMTVCQLSQGWGGLWESAEMTAQSDTFAAQMESMWWRGSNWPFRAEDLWVHLLMSAERGGWLFFLVVFAIRPQGLWIAALKAK